MLFFRLLPAALGLLALAAHFLRGGKLEVAAACVAALALLTVPRAWAGRLVQVILVLGAGIWLLTAWELAQIRAQHGAPVGRMILILGGVAVFSAFAAWLLRRGRGRSWFGAAAPIEAAEAPAAQATD